MCQYKKSVSASFSSIQMFLGQKDPVQSWSVQNGHCKVETNRKVRRWIGDVNFEGGYSWPWFCQFQKQRRTEKVAWIKQDESSPKYLSQNEVKYVSSDVTISISFRHPDRFVFLKALNAKYSPFSPHFSLSRFSSDFKKKPKMNFPFHGAIPHLFHSNILPIN